MGSLLFDLRHCVRALLKSPVFTAVTVLTLALGIGANSAIFSLVNAVLLRPLGYQEPERLMMIHEIIPGVAACRASACRRPTISISIRYQRSFTRPRRVSHADDGAVRHRRSGAHHRRADSAAVFPLLGVGAAEGRTFLAEEDQAEQAVAIISETLRRRRFAASSPIGERITLDRRPYTIVGVMPAGFEFPKRGPQFNGEPADVYLPLVFNPFERQARGMFYNHSVIGRLKDGVAMEQARATPRRWRRASSRTIRRSSATRVDAADRGDADDGRDRRPGAAAAADPARRRRPRAARRLRERRQPVPQPRRRAAARDGRARGARRSRHRLFQMLLVESLLLALASGVARAADRQLGAARRAGGADREPARRLRRVARCARRRVHARLSVADRAVLRPGADGRRHAARADRRAARRARDRPAAGGSIACRPGWS